MKVAFGTQEGDHFPSFSLYFEGPSSASCQAACEHCYIPRDGRNGTHLETCLEQFDDLVARSYTIEPKVPDTFSRDGEYLRMGILRNNHLYAQQEIKKCGIAWTSGLPLLRGNGEQLLDLAHDCNLSIISFTGPALVGLIKGLVPASVTEAAIRFVQGWNRRRPSEHRFKISITFTIGHLNKDPDLVRSYIEYTRKLSADFIRFNRFIDFTEDRRFRNLIMSDEETAQFFADIAPILACYDSPTVMVSNDFGFTGIEAIGGHKGLNDCSGGTGSFAIFNSLVFPCDELLRYPIGKLVRNPDDHRWDVQFKPGALKALAAMKRSGAYNGCIAHLFASTNQLSDSVVLLRS